MSNKTKKILSAVLLIIPSLMVVLSGLMKLSGSEEVVKGLSQAGYSSLISILGAAEIIFVALLWFPKTWKLGLLFLLSYLGGAAAIEISGGKPPVALVFIALLWAGAYFKDTFMFVKETTKA